MELLKRILIAMSFESQNLVQGLHSAALLDSMILRVASADAFDVLRSLAVAISTPALLHGLYFLRSAQVIRKQFRPGDFAHLEFSPFAFAFWAWFRFGEEQTVLSASSPNPRLVAHLFHRSIIER